MLGFKHFKREILRRESHRIRIFIYNFIKAMSCAEKPSEDERINVVEDSI